MVFTQFFKRLSPFRGNQKRLKYERFKRALQEESARISLDEANKLIAERKYNQALLLINKTIENGTTSNQLLFNKAFLLSQIKQYEKAHNIWSDLSKLQNKPKLADSAKQHLERSKETQRQATKLLLENLHEKARDYQHPLKHLPNSKDWTPNTDIIQLIRKEAELARTAELPGLSTHLIDQSLQAGLQSPLLVHDKALSISMMGEQVKALELLRELRQTIKNPQLRALFTSSEEELIQNSNYHQSKLNTYLAKQAKSAARKNSLKIEYIPETEQIEENINIKELIFKESRGALRNHNPHASLDIINTILDFDAGNLAALQLKGEALSALKKHEEAIKIWKDLTHSNIESIAKTASRLILQSFTDQAKSISTTDSPKAALLFFIEKHLTHHLTPRMNKEMEKELIQIDPQSTDFSDPELQQHRIQLLFNTLVIECLETQWRDRGRFDASATAQKPGTISKTALKAG